jgi:integrase
MARTIPYLQRRGDAFNFRMAVPADLRSILKSWELTKALDTDDRLIAESRCFVLAARAKQLFQQLRQMIKDKKVPDGSITMDYTVQFDMTSLRKVITVNAEPHEQEAVNQSLDKLANMAAMFSLSAEPTLAISDARSVALSDQRPASPMLRDLAEQFLDKYPKKKEEMLKKHRACIPAFCEVVGNKPVSELRRADFQDFFDILHRLPPRWADIKRREGKTMREIADQEHPVLISAKTFGYTYKTSINQFLDWAKENYRDQGFPEITIDKITYEGDREEGVSRQRPFTIVELGRLFSGPEMEAFAKNCDEAHRYWLPTLGLFTGARVNELCQLNPQVDILQDADSGIWYFWFTGETEGNEKIRKRTKNAVSKRTTPIHSVLITLGFLDYVKRIKKAGATLLFPPWEPQRGRASPQAEDWFSDFLRDLGLRDETKGQRLVGMHAFRHTFSNAAMNAGVDESAIVGHVKENETEVARGYRGTLALINKQKILEKIKFDLTFFTPV